MPTLWLTDTQKIGVAFCAAGLIFLLAGVTLFFDRALLAFGNILFIIGLVCTIGLSSTSTFFFSRRQKLPGTAAFFAGVLLILIRWTFVGFLVEGYGIFILFGDFLGTAGNFVRGVPVVGPPIANLLGKIAGASRRQQQGMMGDLPV